MRIGFAGTGLMGKPMIEKLLENNYSVNVFNRTKSKAISLENLGAKICNSFDEMANNSDVIIFMVTDFNAVFGLLQDCQCNLSGKHILQMSTISPIENLELKNYANKKNAKFIEAPVLGSIPQILSRELITFIGAEQKISREIEKIFQCFSKEIIFIGQVGKASALKLAINQLIASELSVFSMSLKYILKNDIDVNIFMNVLRESALYAPTFDKKLNNFLTNNFSNPNFPLKHMLKDVRIIIDEFTNKGINTEILQAEKTLLEKGIADGFEDEDYSALYKSFDNSETK